MKYCLLFLSFIVMLSGCNNKATSYFTTSNLASSFISIEADKDYTLQTGKGAVIKIAKGSFNTNGNEKIQLELKEAYSMQDILLAGLSTESNGAPLQSGGMIYINAKVEGRQLELLKPIAVSLPASVYDEQMQLFKGEIKADSSINWINPQPLDTSPVAKNISLGKYLYRSNCASCHKIFSLYTAGPMAGTSDRIPNREWLYKFIHNPAKMIATDPYAHKLYQQYQPTVMTSFPQLTKQDIDAIYDFVENEMKQNPDSMIQKLFPPATGALDDTSHIKEPCGVDTFYIPKRYNNIEIIDTTPVPINNSNNEINQRDATQLGEAVSSEGLRNGFTDPNFTEGVYDFEVQTLGWYNIDQYIKGYEGTNYVTLNAELTGDPSASMNLYLFCPKRKMLSVGVDYRKNKFIFDKVEGKIPLYLGDDAVLLAFGSNHDKMFYGIVSFKVKQEQNISISIKETTEEQLKQMILDNNIEGIKIDPYKKEFEIKKRQCDDEHFAADSTKPEKVASK